MVPAAVRPEGRRQPILRLRRARINPGNLQSEICNQYTYDAYGSVLSATDPAATPHQYLGKLGYYTDAASGLQLLTQRYYDPVVGRFVTEDPVREGGSWFGYATSAPTTAVDPAGETPWVCLTACACAGIGGMYAAAGCYAGCRTAVDPGACRRQCIADVARDSDWRIRMTEACIAGCGACVARLMAQQMAAMAALMARQADRYIRIGPEANWRELMEKYGRYVEAQRIRIGRSAEDYWVLMHRNMRLGDPPPPPCWWDRYWYHFHLRGDPGGHHLPWEWSDTMMRHMRSMMASQGVIH